MFTNYSIHKWVEQDFQLVIYIFKTSKTLTEQLDVNFLKCVGAAKLVQLMMDFIED